MVYFFMFFYYLSLKNIKKITEFNEKFDIIYLDLPIQKEGLEKI